MQRVNLLSQRQWFFKMLSSRWHCGIAALQSLICARTICCNCRDLSNLEETVGSIERGKHCFYLTKFIIYSSWGVYQVASQCNRDLFMYIRLHLMYIKRWNFPLRAVFFAILKGSQSFFFKGDIPCVVCLIY